MTTESGYVSERPASESMQIGIALDRLANEFLHAAEDPLELALLHGDAEALLVWIRREKKGRGITVPRATEGYAPDTASRVLRRLAEHFMDLPDATEEVT